MYRENLDWQKDFFYSVPQSDRLNFFFLIPTYAFICVCLSPWLLHLKSKSLAICCCLLAVSLGVIFTTPPPPCLSFSLSLIGNFSIFSTLLLSCMHVVVCSYIPLTLRCVCVCVCVCTVLFQTFIYMHSSWFDFHFCTLA